MQHIIAAPSVLQRLTISHLLPPHNHPPTNPSWYLNHTSSPILPFSLTPPLLPQPTLHNLILPSFTPHLPLTPTMNTMDAPTESIILAAEIAIHEVTSLYCHPAHPTWLLAHHKAAMAFSALRTYIQSRSLSTSAWVQLLEAGRQDLQVLEVEMQMPGKASDAVLHFNALLCWHAVDEMERCLAVAEMNELCRGIETMW